MSSDIQEGKKDLVHDILYQYVALVPILFQTLSNEGVYPQFLKQLMLALIVSFQEAKTY